ncbi:MAG: hypothetical protein ABW046_17995 [Actinoplanes sp.]
MATTSPRTVVARALSILLSWLAAPLTPARPIFASPAPAEPLPAAGVLFAQHTAGVRGSRAPPAAVA